MCGTRKRLASAGNPPECFFHKKGNCTKGSKCPLPDKDKTVDDKKKVMKESICVAKSPLRDAESDQHAKSRQRPDEESGRRLHTERGRRHHAIRLFKKRPNIKKVKKFHIFVEEMGPKHRRVRNIRQKRSGASNRTNGNKS